MATHSQFPHSADNDSALQAILQTAIDGIVTIDVQGIICSANPATERIFGYRAEELIGNNVNMLMDGKERREHDSYISNYLRTGERKIIGIGREVYGRRKDGSHFPLELSISEWTSGKQRYFTGLLRDITQRREYEKQLSQLNAELENRVAERTQALHQAQADLVSQERLATLGRVAGGIAHEIRNPLNAIKTSAYFLLRSQEIPPEKLIEHLDRIDRQANLANEVVSALTNYAKMPAPSLHNFDVVACVRESIRTTEICPHHNISLQCEDGIPPAVADGSQIRIALRNLIRNARDAMPLGGSIRIEICYTAHEQEITISIIDSGVGLTTAEVQRVAEPLYTTKTDGLGLGLAITTSILEHNHARMSVQSIPRVGSTFRIHLRAAERATDKSDC
ncbi:MAG: PAS domain S-box protein [Planctomycetota bacterium]|nr:PAS domain S-box protein [Planctomycetota bacterium]